VLAASNRPELLDPALVRPGRFDRTITIGLPDRAGRRAILAVHAANKPLAADVDLDVLAGLTRGLSGADLANVLNEAALLATRRGLTVIPLSVVEAAIERVTVGIARAHVLSEEERTMVAYHEVGHALAARSLPGGKVPHKLSIVARGRALGATWHTEPSDRLVHSRSALVDEMAIALGGRVAEELVFGEPGSGAADDLARVSAIARQMVLELGMSEALGTLAYPDGVEDGGAWSRYSEGTAVTIDSEVRRLVGEAHARAHEVLRTSRAALDRVAAALLERETLSAAELEEIIDSAPSTPRQIRGKRQVGAGGR